MKNAVLVLFFAFIPLAVAGAQMVRVEGDFSSTNFAQQAGDLFRAKDESADIVAQKQPSGDAFDHLRERQCDIVLSARKPLDKEIRNFARQGVKVNSRVIAYIGCRVVVNPLNPVEKLTQAQLKDILSGTLINWQDAGGEDVEMLPVLPKSAPYRAAINSVFDDHGGAGIGRRALEVSGPDEVLAQVEENPGAIGFITVRGGQPQVKVVSLSTGKGAYYPPDQRYIADGSYPLRSGLYAFYLEDAPEVVKRFLDFIGSGSEEVAGLMWKSGYAPVKTPAPPEQQAGPPAERAEPSAVSPEPADQEEPSE